MKSIGFLRISGEKKVQEKMVFDHVIIFIKIIPVKKIFSSLYIITAKIILIGLILWKTFNFDDTVCRQSENGGKTTKRSLFNDA